MLNDKKISEHIEILRKKLNDKINNVDSLLDLEVLSLSEELDLLIIEYNLNKEN